MMITPPRQMNGARAAVRTETGRSPSAAGSGYAGVASSGQGAAAQGARPVHPMAALDALVALQAVDDPAGRRARTTRRGNAILDDLDALKLALLEGRNGLGELDRMIRNVEASRESIDDEGLDGLIDAIELRARVEMAKRGR